jgi:hypothetical protein
MPNARVDAVKDDDLDLVEQEQAEEENPRLPAEIIIVKMQPWIVQMRVSCMRQGFKSEDIPWQKLFGSLSMLLTERN